jgi:hypothetical protein
MKRYPGRTYRSSEEGTDNSGGASRLRDVRQKARAGAAGAGGNASVFRRKHDSQNALGLFMVARIFAAARHCFVVVVDLPENANAAIFKRSEVVFPVWVVIRGERIESLYLLADFALVYARQGLDTGCLNNPANYAPGLAAKIVQFGDFGG